MKPILTFTIEDRLDSRERNRPFGPLTDYFYQPRGKTMRTGDSAQGRNLARRAFRRMTTKMRESYDRVEPPELIAFFLVSVIVAWTLVSLLTVFSETGYGW